MHLFWLTFNTHTGTEVFIVEAGFLLMARMKAALAGQPGDFSRRPPTRRCDREENSGGDDRQDAHAIASDATLGSPVEMTLPERRLGAVRTAFLTRRRVYKLPGLMDAASYATWWECFEGVGVGSVLRAWALCRITANRQPSCPTGRQDGVRCPGVMR
jgi:hypothetical protein